MLGTIGVRSPKKNKPGTWKATKGPSLPQLSYVWPASGMPLISLPLTRLPCLKLWLRNQTLLQHHPRDSCSHPTSFFSFQTLNLKLEAKMGAIPEKKNHWIVGSLRTGPFPSNVLLCLVHGPGSCWVSGEGREGGGWVRQEADGCVWGRVRVGQCSLAKWTNKNSLNWTDRQLPEMASLAHSI